MSSLFDNNLFAGSLFASNLFAGAGDQGEVDVDYPCDHHYCDRDDVELVYGRSNVAKWADLNNDQDENDIAERIGWACCLATSEIDDRLRDGPYDVPFEEPWALSLVDATARLAGTLLYDSRGAIDVGADDDPAHSLAPMRKRVEKFIKSVLAGRTRPGASPDHNMHPINVDPTLGTEAAADGEETEWWV